MHTQTRSNLPCTAHTVAGGAHHQGEDTEVKHACRSMLQSPRGCQAQKRTRRQQKRSNKPRTAQANPPNLPKTHICYKTPLSIVLRYERRSRYFGVLIIRILLFRVLYWALLFSETPKSESAASDWSPWDWPFRSLVVLFGCVEEGAACTG